MYYPIEMMKYCGRGGGRVLTGQRQDNSGHMPYHPIEILETMFLFLVKMVLLQDNQRIIQSISIQSTDIYATHHKCN
jgi:hypothetical protein